MEEQLLLYASRVTQLESENATLRKQLQAKDEMLDILQEGLLRDTMTIRRPKKLNIVAAKDIDTNLISTSFIPNTTMASMDYDNAPLMIQTPCMESVFGITSWEGRKSILLSATSEQGRVFLNRLQDIERVIEKSLQNKNLISVVKDVSSHGLCFRVGLPKNESNDLRAFDSSRKSMSLDKCLAKGSNLTALIRCNGIWYSDQRCGVSWSLLQVRQEYAPAFEGYAMLDI
jgi:uncharacterized protein (UPF0335 family)